MSKSSRPISLQSAIVIRRAQAEQAQRRQAAASSPASASATRRHGFSIRSIVGLVTRQAGNDDQPVEGRKQAA